MRNKPSSAAETCTVFLSLLLRRWTSDVCRVTFSQGVTSLSWFQFKLNLGSRIGCIFKLRFLADLRLIDVYLFNLHILSPRDPSSRWLVVHMHKPTSPNSRICWCSMLNCKANIIYDTRKNKSGFIWAWRGEKQNNGNLLPLDGSRRSFNGRIDLLPLQQRSKKPRGTAERSRTQLKVHSEFYFIFTSLFSSVVTPLIWLLGCSDRKGRGNVCRPVALGTEKGRSLPPFPRITLKLFPFFCPRSSFKQLWFLFP